MEPHFCVGIDVGCKAHRVGIAHPDGSILEEFDISHTDAGFQEFFRRIEKRSCRLSLPVAVAMEGYNGYARPLDRLVLDNHYRLYNVNDMKLAQFKKIFPGPAKTDAIDTRKILELFTLKEHLCRVHLVRLVRPSGLVSNSAVRRPSLWVTKRDGSRIGTPSARTAVSGCVLRRQRPVHRLQRWLPREVGVD